MVDTTLTSDQSITSNSTNRHHVPPEIVHQEGHNVTLVIILPKINNLYLIMRKHHTNPNSRTFIKITGLYSSKCQAHEKQSKAEENIPN